MRWCKWRTKERWWLRLIVCLVVRVSLIYGWRPESREMLRASPIALYSCPFNSMCHCLTLPNETTVLEINCNEVSLYKFPGKLVWSELHPDKCCGLIISLYADGPCLYLSGIIVCPLRARIKEVMMMKKGRFVSVVLNKIT